MNHLRKSFRVFSIANKSPRSNSTLTNSNTSENSHVISHDTSPKQAHFRHSGKMEKPTVNTNAENSSSVYISNLPRHTGGSCVLLIDPQVDFVTGSLKVPGAVEDCKRISDFLVKNTDFVQEIYVTMDTHMNYHIAHPLFWYVGDTFEHPQHFTQITHQDILDGKFTPIDKSQKMIDWVLYYTQTLEKESQFTLVIWPPHCIIGTNGHNVEPHIAEALASWEKDAQTTKCVHYIFKGNNSKSEHYSAFKAEVEVTDDKNTRLNVNLLNDLKTHKKIYIAGEAKSHCVNFTVRHLVSELGPEEARKKLVLLDLGMSSVATFEKQGEEFFADMRKVGISIENINTCAVQQFTDVELKTDIVPEEVEKAAKSRSSPNKAKHNQNNNGAKTKEKNVKI